MNPSRPSPRRPRLSVAMIVRDEQQVLPASIDSVRAIADEIVVLDTGSTDHTPAVAEKAGAVVARCPWHDDFAAARNTCLRLVTGEWVLWLDAGERLSADSAAELRQFVDHQADPRQVYTLLVEVPPPDPAGCGEHSARVRLMPNRPDLRFAGRVRESLHAAIEAAGLAVEAAPGRIVRHPRQHQPAIKAAKAQRDLALAALEGQQAGAMPARLLLATGEACSNLGLMDRARDAFRKALAAAQPGSTEMLEAYYGLLAAFDGDPSLGEVQLSVCLEGLKKFPCDAQLLLAMGNYLQQKQQLDLAARAFQTAAQHGRVDRATWHLTELAEVAAACFALICQLQGRTDDARQALEAALQRHPHSLRLLRHLIDLGIKQGRCDEAVELVGRLPFPAEQVEWLRTVVRGACRAVAKDWTAALAYLQAAYLAGCQDPLLLRWLSVTLLSNGQVAAAEPVLRQWQQWEPNNAELRAYLAALEPCDEALPAEGPPAASAADGKPPDDQARRKLRLDAAGSVLRTAPPQLPIVGSEGDSPLLHRS